MNILFINTVQYSKNSKEQNCVDWTERLKKHFCPVDTVLFFTYELIRFVLVVSTPHFFVFTARCYASAVLAMALCPSVCPSVRHKSVFY